MQTQLVAAQRSKPRTSISSIMVDDRLLTDEAEVLNAWADHFESLGRPLEDDSFDSNYLTQVFNDIEAITYNFRRFVRIAGNLGSM